MPALWAVGPASKEMLAAWTLIECDLLGLCGQGALSTWGRLVVAGDIEAAAAALDRHVPAATSQFVVQPDLTAVAPAELVRTVQTELESMADLESRGAAVVYRFTQASVRRCFEAGRTADEILAFLADHAARGVPQALTYLVHDVGRRFGQIRAVATACCLRSDDPSLLAEVVASRAAKRLGLRLLAPTVAAASADVATVLAALRDAGYAPAEEGSDGAIVLSRPPSRRAVPDRRLAALARRRPGVGPGFGPVGDPFGRRPRRRPGPTTAGCRPPGRWWAPSSTATSPRPSGRPQRRRRRPPRRCSTSSPPSPARPRSSGRPRPSPICSNRRWTAGWPVRLAYTGKKGRVTQLTASVLEVGLREVDVALVDDWEDRVLALGRIEWARVLTEAEEDAL